MISGKGLLSLPASCERWRKRQQLFLFCNQRNKTVDGQDDVLVMAGHNPVDPELTEKDSIQYKIQYKK